MKAAKGVLWLAGFTCMLVGLALSASAQQTVLGVDEQPEHGLQQALSAVRAGRARLESPDRPEGEPAAMLKFDVTNDGIVAVRDVVVRIGIYEKQPDAAASVPRAVVRPVDIRTHATIQPGFTLEYEMLFRNLAADCDCIPKVTIVSARTVRD
jgi:hypothetical protein